MGFLIFDLFFLGPFWHDAIPPPEIYSDCGVAWQEPPVPWSGTLYNRPFPPSQRVVIEDGKIYKLTLVGTVKNGTTYKLDGTRWGWLGEEE